MVNRKQVKIMMLNMLLFRMQKGEKIKIEYSSEEKMKEARAYFPENMIHRFQSKEIIEIIKCAMGVIHKELSDNGIGEVIMISVPSMCIDIYGLHIYEK